MRVYGPDKQWIEVLSAYPQTKQIQGKLRDGGLVYVSILDVPPSFRWPQTGEVWSITRDPIDNVTWNLCSRVHGYKALPQNGGIAFTEVEDFDITVMDPGEMRLDSSKIYDDRGMRLAPVDLTDINNGESLVWNDSDQVFKAGAGGGGGMDTGRIGMVMAWTGNTIPTDYVLANGQSLTRAAYPDGYDFAKSQKDGGSTLWDYNAGAGTFVVPDLSNRFIFASGSRTVGTKSQTN
ncbi:MAG TPA: phage tail protein, partial [Pyrinomonadaceae bacterium]